MDIFNGVIWLVSFVLFLIVELVTVSLVSIWFAGGALVAMLIATLGGGTILQVVVFLVVSLVLLIFTRPFALNYINSTRIKTNYEGIIGKVVRITEDVDNMNGTGCATVNGQEWTVRSVNDNNKIEAGKLAKVVNIKGVKLIVDKYEEEMTV